MHPILFEFGSLKIYSYGFCIMLGALAAYYYALRQGKQLGVSQDTMSEMALLIIVAAYAGGKVFLWFEDINYYLSNPSKMFALSGSGFVFYGSFIFCITGLLVFFKIKKLKSAPIFDVLAVSTAFVHGFGKIGCLMAGCCHGKTCSPALGIVYTNPKSQAPLNITVYPVQLYDAAIILLAALFLIWYNKRKQFSGELMLWYVFIYGTGRFFTEFLRGDEERGIVNGLSNSQWISMVLLIVATALYAILKNKSNGSKHRK
jgi:phosphatidylglycerol---prolipoprotein diacylglyceryl transferase